MVILRFNDENVWRDCCDASNMLRRWGAERTHQIAHRLQQLDAMTSLTDLEFLPLDSHTLDGRVEVDVDDELALVLDLSTPPRQGDLMATVVVRSLLLRSKNATR